MVVLGVAVLAGLAGASYYYYSRYQHAQELLKDPTAAAKEETAKLASRVALHIVLPNSEVPTVATVSDKSKLVGQPFFARAEVGDKVLIYQATAKAILYRPTIDRIIEVMNLAPAVAGAATESAQLESAKLAIYNSTTRAGLASVAQQRVDEKIKNITTVNKSNSSGPFAKSALVVLNSQASGLGQQIAAIFKADVKTEMPINEVKPDADILLIVGEDFVQ